MPQLPPPRDPSKPAVIVWCPERRRWLRATSTNLGWFAVRIGRLEADIAFGTDAKAGNGDPTERTPLDHCRTLLANLSNMLGFARRKIEDAEKQRRGLTQAP